MKFSFRINRKSVIISLVVLLIPVIGYFAVRGFILEKAIQSINNRITSRNYTSQWKGASFKGIKTLFVQEISLRSNTGNNMATVDSIYIKVKILPLLFKKVRVKRIDCRSVALQYNFEDSLPVKTTITGPDTNMPFQLLKGKDMAGFLFKNVRRFFSYVPAQVTFRQIKINCRYLGINSEFALHDFTLLKGRMESFLVLAGDSLTNKIPLTGKIDKSSSVIEVNLSNSDTSLLPSPLLRDKYGFETGFDSLSFYIDLSERHRHEVQIKGRFSFTGFELKGKRLSMESIQINAFRSSFNANVGKDFIEIDSSTTAWLNSIRLNPYLKLSLLNSPKLAIKIRPVYWDAGVFFKSLPSGMFSSLTGLEAQGLLHYYLNFMVDFSNPDSLLFDTRLTAKDFKINKFGADDYRMMNGSFTHRVYEKGRMVAAFTVGPENPYFTPFEQISPFLRAAVMTSEDGSFFYHNGFNPGAFRESVVTNIKEKRFARGGSTISMQLVKNVFLTRNKTLARKIEEAIIVWLIENKNLVPKQRMYEVYLNIIEWGPGIYGVDQASHFYFNKKPADLTMEESIYLASIVPHPKWYKYSFETNGQLRNFYNHYFNRLKELMVRKEFVMASDTFGIKPYVLLTGPAALVFVKTDTIVSDSVNLEELEVFPTF